MQTEDFKFVLQRRPCGLLSVNQQKKKKSRKKKVYGVEKATRLTDLYERLKNKQTKNYSRELKKESLHK